MPQHRLTLRVNDARREVAAALVLAAGAVGLEEAADTLEAWFAERPSPDEPALARLAALDITGSWDAPPDRDWQAAWKAGLEPVAAGPFLVVPSWYEPSAPAAASGVAIDVTGGAPIVLVLDPGRAFGSGHDPTTLACLEALGALDLAGRRVLDVGCGSGILAIAAARRGAEVVAVDIDAEAVRATRDNAARNAVTVDVRLGGPDVAGTADVVVANLVTGTLVALADALVAATTATLIVSGVVTERIGTVRAALTDAGLAIDEVRERDGWAVIVGHRIPAGAAPGRTRRRALAAGVVALLLVGCTGGVVPDTASTDASEPGAGPGGATQPEALDPTGDALRDRLIELDLAVGEIEGVLRSVATAEDLETARRRGRYAMSLLVESPATDPATVALLPSTAAERDADERRPDLLTGTITLAGDDTSPLARVVLELLRDPIAGDLGAWQRDPAGVVAQARAVVDDGRGSDAATLAAAIGELDGDATRAYAWAYALSLTEDLDTAKEQAARGAAHLAVVRVGISIALEQVGAPPPTDDGP